LTAIATSISGPASSRRSPSKAVVGLAAASDIFASLRVGQYYPDNICAVNIIRV
jgi:hypothetical protein